MIGWAGKVLADHPDQRRELVADPSLIPNAIEEILRYEPPAPHVARYVGRDVEHYGQTVPEGSVMIFLVGAANRDDRRFPDGDRFDIHREVGQHLTFGYGIHFCLGAALARLEGRIALDEVLKRFPEWDVDLDHARLVAHLHGPRLGDAARHRPVRSAIERFEIHVDDAVLDDLRDRLARTRLPDQIEGTGWEYGIPLDYLAELVDVLARHLRLASPGGAAQRARALPHPIDDQSIHFVHARSPHADALPLLLVHGWPGSIVEFLDVIPRLTDPEAHGGAASDAFHVVAPSLPGYGFSEPTRTRGWDVVAHRAAFVELMHRLGYARYAAQGGDWGAQVATRIGALDPEHCAAIHLNMPIADPPEEPVALTDADQADLAAMQRFAREESGYADGAVDQAADARRRAQRLAGRPARLDRREVPRLERLRRPPGERLHPRPADHQRDDLLGHARRSRRRPGCTGSTCTPARRGAPACVEVPTGVARYPKEVLRFPRSWVERRYNVTYWADMPRGGHFAAMEQPELFVDDLRAFFRTVR